MRWNQIVLAALIVVISLTGQAIVKRGLVQVRAAAACIGLAWLIAGIVLLSRS